MEKSVSGLVFSQAEVVVVVEEVFLLYLVLPEQEVGEDSFWCLFEWE